MRPLRLWLSRAASLIVVALAVAAGIAYGSDSEQPAATIQACYDTSTGALRLVNGRACGRDEGSLEWNQQGPQGIPGPQGPTGPAGKTGPAKHWVAPWGIGDTGPSYVHVFNPTQFNAKVEIQFFKYSLIKHKMLFKKKCAATYGPGRVTPECGYSGDPKRPGFIYVVSDRPILPYGWALAHARGAPPKGDSVASLPAFGGYAVLQWYPMCPPFFPKCEGVED